MKYSLLVLFGMSFFASCLNKKQEALFVDYSEKLDSISSLYSTPQPGEYPVDLCQLFNKNSWDSIAFILPYLPISELEEMNFCNFSAARDTMEYVVGVEWNYGLLFLKDNCIISYSVVGGNPSFAEIIGKDVSTIPILKRSGCRVKLINAISENNEQSFFFVPLEYPTDGDRNETDRFRENSPSLDSLMP